MHNTYMYSLYVPQVETSFWVSKNRFITILDVFDGGSLHEVCIYAYSCSELKIRIHRIVTYVLTCIFIYETHNFDELLNSILMCSSCVTFAPYYQVRIYYTIPVKCHPQYSNNQIDWLGILLW